MLLSPRCSGDEIAGYRPDTELTAGTVHQLPSP